MASALVTKNVNNKFNEHNEFHTADILARNYIYDNINNLE